MILIIVAEQKNKQSAIWKISRPRGISLPYFMKYQGEPIRATRVVTIMKVLVFQLTRWNGKSLNIIISITVLIICNLGSHAPQARRLDVTLDYGNYHQNPAYLHDFAIICAKNAINCGASRSVNIP